jgi:nucleotide-binding universal stress UspA family protein
MGARSIQAYVTEVQAKVSLSAQAGREELILKQEYAQFLEATRLDEIRPGADLILSEPGGYEELEEHIAVHRYFMGLEAEREIRYTKAVAHWYDHIYLPVVQRIRELGILRHFPGRTETDLYLWVSKHRAALQESLGWEIDPGAAASDLAALEGEEGAQALERGITSVESPDQLDRLLVEANEGGERMFTDLLVPLRGDPQGWAALAQALAIARLEGGRILGLHVSSEGHPREEAKVDRMKRTFREHCEGSGVRGSLAIEVGTVATQICRRSTLSDLLVIHLAHPPERTPIARLSSGFRRLIRECAVPILAVPFPAAPIRRALLAYDGTPKANQALFLAAYLAGRWKLELSVITAKTNPQAAEGIQTRARKYLEQHQVGAAFLRARPPTGEAILEASERDESDLILMGGYGTHTLLTTVLGSTVDHVLRYSRRPVWICN